MKLKWSYRIVKGFFLINVTLIIVTWYGILIKNSRTPQTTPDKGIQRQVTKEKGSIIIDEWCTEKTGGTIRTKIQHYFVYSEEHNLLYCFVPKSGCTTWLGVMASATSKGNKVHRRKHSLVHNSKYMIQQGVPLMANLSKEYKIYVQKNSTKFLVVRHPIDRIVSAYWNKIAHLQSSKHYSKVRKSLYSMNMTKGDPSFQQFIRNVLSDSWKYRKDRHWKPIHRICDPCNVKYDYVIKLENNVHTDEDIQMVLRTLSSKKKTVKYLENIVTQKINSNKNTKLDVFLTLSMKERYDLVNKYVRDMQLFGYGINLLTGKRDYEKFDISYKC